MEGLIMQEVRYITPNFTYTDNLHITLHLWLVKNGIKIDFIDVPFQSLYRSNAIDSALKYMNVLEELIYNSGITNEEIGKLVNTFKSFNEMILILIYKDNENN